jgi:acyl dehydratase
MFFEDLHEGYELEGTTITVTEAHVVAYAGLVGDFYKLHMDKEAAAKTPYGKRVAHGPFTFALTIGQLAQRLTHLDVRVEAVVGMSNFKFFAPVFFDDTITPLARIVGLRQRKTNGAVTLEMRAQNQTGQTVFQGEFTLFVELRDPETAALSNGAAAAVPTA